MISNLIYKKVPKYKFTYEDKYIELPSSIDKDINDNWEELMSSGKTYTNGQVFTIEAIQFDKCNCLNFKMVKSNFAHYMYTMKQKYEGDYICRSVATSALILTNDGYYVLGRMRSNTSLPGKVKLIGGAIDKKDFIDNELSTETAISREVMEEIGLNLKDKNQVNSVELKYFLSRKNLSFVNPCFKVNVNLSSKDMIKQFKNYDEYLANNNLEQELSSIVLIKNNKDEVNKFLKDNKECTLDYVQELLLVDVGIKEAKNLEHEVLKR